MVCAGKSQGDDDDYDNDYDYDYATSTYHITTHHSHHITSLLVTSHTLSVLRINNSPSQHPLSPSQQPTLSTHSHHPFHTTTADGDHYGRRKPSTTPSRMDSQHRSSHRKNVLFSFKNRRFSMESPVLFHACRGRKNASLRVEIFGGVDVSSRLSSLLCLGYCPHGTGERAINLS